MKTAKNQALQNTARSLGIKYRQIAQYCGIGKRSFTRRLRAPLSKAQEGKILWAITDIAKEAAGDRSISGRLYFFRADHGIVFLWEIAHRLGLSEGELISQVRAGLDEAQADAVGNAMVELLQDRALSRNCRLREIASV